MNLSHRAHPLVARFAVLALPAMLSAGCASTDIQAQWTDPEFANRSLQGATVLVDCDAHETALRRICREQLSQQLRAAGAVPVVSDGAEGAADAPGKVSEATLSAAREAGARAVLTSRIAPDAMVVSPRPSIGIGVGSWGGSVGSSVGVSVPVGGERVNTAYGADLVLTDVASGRMMWTSKVTTPASRDVNAQLAKLAKSGVDAAKQAGLF